MLYYTLIIHSDIGIEGASELYEIHPLLSARPEILKTSQYLQSQLISISTRILFTVSTAGHMASTDTLAEHWITSVISPALSDPTGGASALVEAFQKICKIDWTELGLCEECMREKREEWKEEINNIWEKIDKWLEPRRFKK